jgi:hypothetical protein
VPALREPANAGHRRFQVAAAGNHVRALQDMRPRDDGSLEPLFGFSMMLWPPPDRGDRATLKCACDVTVKWRVPFIFLYAVVIDARGAECSTSCHAPDRHTFVPLERFTAGRGGPPPS